MKGIGPDVAHRGLHRIGLARRARLGLRPARVVPAATGAEAATAATEAAPARRRAWVLHKPLVEGLLQRIRNARVVDLFLEVRIGVGAARGLAALWLQACHSGGVRGVLEPVFRAVARATVVARLVAWRSGVVAWLYSRVVALLVAWLIAWLSAHVLAAPAVARRIAIAVAVRACVGVSNRRCQTTDGTHVTVFQVHPHAALQATRQHHGSIADSDQPADGEFDRIEQFAHLAVASFGDDDTVPMIGAFTAAVFDRAEAGGLPVDVHPFEQLRLRGFVESAEHANRVFAFHAEARVHQLVRQFAGIGEQQQAFGVQVEPAHRLPLALLKPRQATEHGRPVLRVVMGDDFTGGLVVGDDARRRRHDAHAHRLAVDLDLVAERDALAGVRRLAVDRDLAVGNPLLHVTPRSDPCLRQHLVQFRRFGFGCKHPLGRCRRLQHRLVFNHIELTGQDLGENLTRFLRRNGGRLVRQRSGLVVIVQIGTAKGGLRTRRVPFRSAHAILATSAVAPTASTVALGARAIASRLILLFEPIGRGFD